MKYLLTMICLIMLAGCGHQPVKKTTITVSAAASLKDALGDIKKNYEKIHPNINIVYNFGASGTLSNQIQAGAPADLFFSASTKDMTKLTAGGDIKQEDSTPLLKNRLVIISSKKLTSPADLTDSAVNKIAVGTPETVPAGMYAKSALTHLHLWSQLQPKIVYTKDVRQVLTYVESGNVDAGIVYLTDALTSKSARLTLADNLHEPIVYPLGIVRATKHRQAAHDFYQYMQSAHSKKVYQSYGFTVQ
nr:molybdate ABC transporter substrate-binding protein [Macrococcus equipercicus]